MTKQREPGSLSDALFQIGATLSVTKAGEVIGKSRQTFYSMADPEAEITPNIRHCLALDTASVEQGGSANILDWYKEQIEKIGKTENNLVLKDTALDVFVALSKFTEVIADAESPTGPGGKRMTHNERIEALKTARAVKSKVDGLVASLERPSALREVG